jgi:hypothetical protein
MRGCEKMGKCTCDCFKRGEIPFKWCPYDLK